MDKCGSAERIVNLRETNFEYYKKFLEEGLAHSPLYQPESETQLDELTNIFTDSCSRALKSACSKQKLKVKHKDLSKQKKEC